MRSCASFAGVCPLLSPPAAHSLALCACSSLGCHSCHCVCDSSSSHFLDPVSWSALFPFVVILSLTTITSIFLLLVLAQGLGSVLLAPALGLGVPTPSPLWSTFQASPGFLVLALQSSLGNCFTIIIYYPLIHVLSFTMHTLPSMFYVLHCLHLVIVQGYMAVSFKFRDIWLFQ